MAARVNLPILTMLSRFAKTPSSGVQVPSWLAKTSLLNHDAFGRLKCYAFAATVHVIPFDHRFLTRPAIPQRVCGVVDARYESRPSLALRCVGGS